MTINKRLKQFGEAKFQTAKDFAEALGIYPQSLNNYYANKRTPSVEIVQRVVALGCNPLWLLTGKGEMLIANKKKNDSSKDGYIAAFSQDKTDGAIKAYQHVRLPETARMAYERIVQQYGIASAWEELDEKQRHSFKNAYISLLQNIIEANNSFDKAVSDLGSQREKTIADTISRFDTIAVKVIKGDDIEVNYQ